mgnify:CR=1 FL=1
MEIKNPHKKSIYSTQNNYFKNLNPSAEGIQKDTIMGLVEKQQNLKIYINRLYEKNCIIVVITTIMQSTFNDITI